MRPVALAALFAIIAAPAWCAEFSPPEKLTPGGEKFRMSRTADSQMATDSAGNLHVAYWSGGDVTDPVSPGYIYHQSWSEGAGWSARVVVDDSEQGGMRIGGRHPSLAVAPDDTVWIVWQDHRHGTAPGAYIDNVEIYADRKPSGGAFSSTDLRLTTSSAAHNGDNGYAPKLAIDAGGRISVVWYDFNADGDVSDLYLKTSAAGGAFNLSESMASMRLTNLNARGGIPAFVTPALALDATGTRRIAWAGGIGADATLYYGETPVGSTTLTPLTLPGKTDYYDPPHVELAPNGDLWIAYGDDQPAAEEITLLRLRAGQTSFDAPVVIESHASRQYQPDLAFDAAGRAHVVWIDRRSGTHVYHARYDPETGATQTKILTTASGPWAGPCIHIDSTDRIFVMWEEAVNLFTLGEIWVSMGREPNGVADEIWERIE